MILHSVVKQLGLISGTSCSSWWTLGRCAYLTETKGGFAITSETRFAQLK